MAAQDLNIAVYVFPPGKNTQGTKANDRYSYINTIEGANLVTLSQRNPNNFDPIQGILYAPTLPGAESCANSTLDLFPSNVTTVDDVYSPGVGLVSVFPWTSVSCTQAFLATSRADAVKAAIVFNTNGGHPPPNGDPSWSLQDGGAYRSNNQFPIYAVSTDDGADLLRNLGEYSGNVSSMPYASVFLSDFPASYFPRLAVSVDVDGSNVPSLWTFLIIVLAILLGLIITVSVIMHFIQRRQRHSLQRRLERGEVDLESLGIKKMNVPQEQISAMPQYTFTGESKGDDVVTTSATSKSPAKSKSKTRTHETAFSQPTCPICLEDFVANETTIRELPCKHIYHPECIDPFLRDNSSLCPMCKMSALPPGFCPVQVTNLMVRRERLVRRMREQRRYALNGGRPPPETVIGKVWHQIQKILRIGVGEPAVRSPAYPGGPGQVGRSQVVEQTQDLELADTQTAAPPSQADNEMPPEIASQSPAARRAWRREYLARQQQRTYDEQAENARRADEGRSWGRRAMDRVLPGFG